MRWTWLNMECWAIHCLMKNRKKELSNDCKTTSIEWKWQMSHIRPCHTYVYCMSATIDQGTLPRRRKQPNKNSSISTAPPESMSRSLIASGDLLIAMQTVSKNLELMKNLKSESGLWLTRVSICLYCKDTYTYTLPHDLHSIKRNLRSLPHTSRQHAELNAKTWSLKNVHASQTSRSMDSKYVLRFSATRCKVTSFRNGLFGTSRVHTSQMTNEVLFESWMHG